MSKVSIESLKIIRILFNYLNDSVTLTSPRLIRKGIQTAEGESWDSFVEERKLITCGSIRGFHLGLIINKDRHQDEDGEKNLLATCIYLFL